MTPPLRRGLAWAALAALVACAIYGFLHEHLFSQYTWTPEGLIRLLGYSVTYWAIVGMILWRWPAWLVPVTSACVFIYSTWWCWEFFNPFAPLAVVYFLGSSLFLGSLLARTADRITSLLVGLAIWIFVISIAVHFPVNRAWVYAAAFGVPYLFAGRARPWMTAPMEWPGATAVLLYILGMHWLIALKPEVSSDGLAVHLAIPFMIARDGLFGFDFQQYTWALMPMNGDLAFAAVYVLAGEAAARLLNFALMVIIVAMVYQGSLRWLPPSGAMMAAALFASTPLVQMVTGSLFVENVWAALVVGAAMALWREELIWAGVLFGSALATKIGTTAFLAPALVMGFFAGKKYRRAAAIAGASVLVFAAPPYLNAWWKTGNPAFPFANNLFLSPYFDLDNAFANLPYQHAGTWNALYDVTFRSKAFFEGRDGGIGFQYFLLLPVVLLLWNRRAPLAPLALGLTGAVVTFVSLPNLRYLYPALPLLSIAIAWSIAELTAELPAMMAAVAVLIAVNLWFLPAAGWYHDDFAVFTRAQMKEYYRVSAPQRKLVEILNGSAPGQPVAFIRGGVIAGLNARGYSDTWHTYRFWERMIKASAPEQVAALFRELGIRYLITPMPPETDFPVVQRFVAEWTAPSGSSSGRFELRNLLDTPLPTPPDTSPVGNGSYDDLDPKVEYTGAWLHDRQFSEASRGSITYSNHAGDSASLFFSGQSILYVHTKAANRGVAEVVIDRRVRARIDLYSAVTQWQKETAFSGLEQGPHTIEIRVTAEKNSKSAGYFADVDRFIVGR